MFAGKKILGVVAARGGSRRLPRKNVLPLAGRPLIDWTLDATRGSKHLDRVILSSDDEDIIAVARASGCEVPFRRPPEFATDTATSADVVAHALGAVEEAYDYVVTLQPTSPLRLAEDIDRCIETCVNGDADSCTTVSRLSKPLAWMFMRSRDGRLLPLSDETADREQKADGDVYILNGAVYVTRVGFFRRTRLLVAPGTLSCVMPAERSCDIDTQDDLCLCEFLLSRKERKSV